MAKKTMIILANGFEEIEAITIIDILRRAGITITICGLNATTVTGSHNITIQTDMTLENYSDNPDAIILPGGMPGSENLAKSQKIKEWLKN